MAEAQSSPSQCALASLTLEEKPTCIIVLGMAGSGKTTFIQVVASEVMVSGLIIDLQLSDGSFSM